MCSTIAATLATSAPVFLGKTGRLDCHARLATCDGENDDAAQRSWITLGEQREAALAGNFPTILIV